MRWITLVLGATVVVVPVQEEIFGAEADIVAANVEGLSWVEDNRYSVWRSMHHVGPERKTAKETAGLRCPPECAPVM